MKLPEDWARALEPRIASFWPALESFVAEERAAHRVHPSDAEVFAAFDATPFDAVRVVLLGQDPYPTAGQAHGLAFSVRPGVAIPASLANLFRERASDLGLPPPPHGWLGAWAARGLLLLNAVLTVRDGEPASHAHRGWEPFTDAVLDALNARAAPCVFVLLGGPARKKRSRVTAPQHRVFEGVHPSPLSAHGGFFGSRPFSAVDALLREVGGAPFDWSIPDEPGPVPTVHLRDAALDAVAAAVPPAPSALAKLLQLPVWRTLSVDEAHEVARALGSVLPATFRPLGVEASATGPIVSFDREGRTFVLVPGATVELGFKGVKAKLPAARRRRFEAQVGVSPEAFLAAASSPVRTVTVGPLLCAVDALPAEAWVGAAPPEAPGPVGALDAALRARGLALPDPDEWEYVRSAGARTWFPWGSDWPSEHGATPSPFGVRFSPDPAAPEWTNDPFRWRAGGLRLPTEATELLWAPSLEADALRDRRLQRPATARIRPVRRVFPYAG